MSSDNFSKDLSLLKKQVCWIIFRFPDKSLKMIKTSLREDLLEGLEIEDNSIYDFENHRWFNLEKVKDTKIEIYTEEPKLREVDLFANKFIR